MKEVLYNNIEYLNKESRGRKTWPVVQCLIRNGLSSCSRIDHL